MPTVTIDDAAFAEAKDLAEQRYQTLDEVVAVVFRDGLKAAKPDTNYKSGFPLLPVRDTPPVTREFVNELREEEWKAPSPVLGSVSQDGFLFETRDGIPVLPHTDGSGPVTSEMVQKMRDEMGV